MTNKLYVGGLPYSITEESLQNLFMSSGRVESTRIIMIVKSVGVKALDS
ncbi:hypothetical protein [Candidatus Chlorohelix allophototropha]